MKVFLANYLEAVGNGPRWQLVEAGIHQGEDQWAGVQQDTNHCKSSAFCLEARTLQGLVGLHPNIFPFFCKKANIK